MLPGQRFLDGTEYVVSAAKSGMILSPTTAAELAARLFWQRSDVPFFLPTSTGSAVAAVRCERGRWLVDCPWCASTQYASRTDLRFFCVSCLNEKGGAKWAAVKWPSNPDLIEAALRPRLTDNASWVSSETVADLLAENILHGVAA